MRENNSTYATERVRLKKLDFSPDSVENERENCIVILHFTRCQSFETQLAFAVWNKKGRKERQRNFSSPFMCAAHKKKCRNREAHNQLKAKLSQMQKPSWASEWRALVQAHSSAFHVYSWAKNENFARLRARKKKLRWSGPHSLCCRRKDGLPLALTIYLENMACAGQRERWNLGPLSRSVIDETLATYTRYISLSVAGAQKQLFISLCAASCRNWRFSMQCASASSAVFTRCLRNLNQLCHVACT